MDLSGAAWRTSSHSGGNGGQCVEVGGVTSHQDGFAALCIVRDSKHPRGPVLAFSPARWRSFIAAVKAGRFGPT